jgi:hypothetical protein
MSHRNPEVIEAALAALLDGQAAQAEQFLRVSTLLNRMIHLMAQEFDNLKAAVDAANQADSAASELIAQQKAEIADLQAQLAAAQAGGIDPAEVQAAADRLNAATAGLNAAVTG